MSSTSFLFKSHRSSLTNTLFQQDYFPKVQPRSSAERDNSGLLHTALKAASTDIAHRLLDYASLDKMDCEASCILIALANHEPSLSNHDSKKTKEAEEAKEIIITKEEEQVVVVEQVTEKEQEEQIIVKEVVEKKDVTLNNTNQAKNDPIMLLMAAAEVVNSKEYQTTHSTTIEKRKRFHSFSSRDNIRLHPNRRSIIEDREAYPNGRYYRKSFDQDNNKRIRPSPPTPASTYKVDTWRKNSRYKNNDHRSTKDQPDLIMDTTTVTSATNNSFSRQYHSMKQNPKVKQNALHTYITYMIYNDLAHGGGVRKTTATPTSTKTTPSTNYSSSYNNNTTKYQQQQQQRPDYYATEPPSLTSSSSSSAATTASSNIATIGMETTPSPWYSSNTSSPSRPSLHHHDDRSILSRPLTAFLWNNTNENSSVTSSLDKKDVMILPPLAARPSPSSISTYDRLPPV